MTTLSDVRAIAAQENFLAVVSTMRPDTTIQSSVVNVGVVPHPVSGDDVLAFVTYGRTKLGNLRAHPYITITVRSGWQWAAVEGTAALVGPDDPDPEASPERLRVLLRDIFSAAGGVHTDLEAYDRAMVDERRVAVLINAQRIYSN
jgi:PPOX class probable F420-dependent enzyme